MLTRLCFVEDDTARWEATGRPRLSLRTKLWVNRLGEMEMGLAIEHHMK